MPTTAFPTLPANQHTARPVHHTPISCPEDVPCTAGVPSLCGATRSFSFFSSSAHPAKSSCLPSQSQGQPHTQYSVLFGDCLIRFSISALGSSGPASLSSVVCRLLSFICRLHLKNVGTSEHQNIRTSTSEQQNNINININITTSTTSDVVIGGQCDDDTGIVIFSSHHVHRRQTSLRCLPSPQGQMRWRQSLSKLLVCPTRLHLQCHSAKERPQRLSCKGHQRTA